MPGVETKSSSETERGAGVLSAQQRVAEGLWRCREPGAPGGLASGAALRQRPLAFGGVNGSTVGTDDVRVQRGDLWRRALCFGEEAVLLHVDIAAVDARAGQEHHERRLGHEPRHARRHIAALGVAHHANAVDLWPRQKRPDGGCGIRREVRDGGGLPVAGALRRAAVVEAVHRHAGARQPVGPDGEGPVAEDRLVAVLGARARDEDDGGERSVAVGQRERPRERHARRRLDAQRLLAVGERRLWRLGTSRHPSFASSAPEARVSVSGVDWPCVHVPTRESPRTSAS